jgi:hypothetical protein
MRLLFRVCWQGPATLQGHQVLRYDFESLAE